MTKRPFDYDPITGMRTDFVATDDGFELHYEQDVEPILDHNKAVQNDGQSFKRKDMWHAASIPVSIQLKWLVEHGVDVFNPDHGPAVKRLLNDPEYRYLRTRNFQL